MKAELPLFPVTVVGSWPRPSWLLEALRRRQAGELSFGEFQEIADRAVLEALRQQEEAGVDMVTDGEQRRDNFYSFVVEKLEGVRLMTVAEMLAYAEDKTFFEQVLRQRDVPAYAIKTPVVVDKVRLKHPLALDELEFLRRHTARPIKVPLPGPYLLTRTMWVKGLSDGAYPTVQDLAAEIVAILRDEVVRLRDAGASFIQLDEPALTEVVFQPPVRTRTFMCASLSASTADPKQELAWAAELVNRTVEGIDGVRIGVHVCRGNWTTNEAALLTGSYEPLVETLAAMKVRQWVLEFATPRAGELGAIRPLAERGELGLGVVNPRSPRVESPEEVTARVEQALAYFPPDRVFLNPDCGFGTFAEAPVATAEVAVAKLRAMAQAAAELRRRYG